MDTLNFDSAHFRKMISKCSLMESVPSLNELVIESANKFYDEFDYYPDFAFSAPGTFTIMGEYLELTGGTIVQAALPLVTLISGRFHSDMKCRVKSLSKDIEEPTRVIFPIPRCKLLKKGFPKWANLLKGVANVFLQKNRKGFDALVHSNIPISRGFGSSSALEAAFMSLFDSRSGKTPLKASVKAKKCKIVDEKFGESKSGSLKSYTAFFADIANAVVIDSSKWTLDYISFRDPNILFLLVLPSSDIAQCSKNLIRMRETELRLAGKLLGLGSLNQMRECHLQVLASMEEPTPDEVAKIVKEFESDEEYVSDFVKNLFGLPTGGQGPSDEAQSSFEGESLEFWKSLEDIPGIGTEKVLEGESFTGLEYKRICDETLCLGGLSDTSSRSQSNFISKLVRRFRYILTEMNRIRSLIKSVNDLDYVSAGMEMTRSHLSLKVDFDVSNPDIDKLVEFTVKLNTGVYGSKMMRNGGTITLLHRNRAHEVIENIKCNFGDGFKYYLVFPSRGGVREVKLIPPKIPKSFLSNEYSTAEELLRKSVYDFELIYKRYPSHGCFAPGSIKIFGDHSYYNQSYALPMATNLVTVVVGALNGSGKIRVATTAEILHEPKKIIFQIPSVKPLEPGETKWANYVKGVVNYFKGDVPGFDCLIESSIPRGSMVSSSAALQSAVYTFIEEITGNYTEDVFEKASLCLKAELDFTYSLSGVDDFAVSLKGLENKLLLVDCKKCTFSYLPSFDPSFVFVLIFKLDYSKPSKCVMYMRLEQCFDVAKILGLKSLRCLKEEDLKGLEDINPMGVKRALHIITEEKRALDGAEALINSDPEKFGRLMVESHISLRDKFEISNQEMDGIVERSMEVDGVFGARMSGSMYGNAVLCLVKRWAVDDLIDYIDDNPSDKLNYYILTPSDGAKCLDVKGYLETLPGPDKTFEKVFDL